ncbi:hypothetical protein CC80DRAFT_487043 [Byssothecium circinans]|uniref:Uncharacterized protein n=1 Tax=Byssothecium circinans TaxID=147558 RepID=A0A6A5UH96_9PLEO|nr:hypothetical protein CC80DRAFT_487043 [Byssothecium circinans]
MRQAIFQPLFLTSTPSLAASKMELQLDASDVVNQDVVAHVVVEEAVDPVAAKELTEFQKTFNLHLPTALKPIKHTSTAVLLLSFDSEAKGSGNLDVTAEVAELEEVLVNDYNFEVENQVITAGQSPQLQVNKYLSVFACEHAKEHALLIIYYAGHGWRSRDTQRKIGFNLHSADPARLESKDAAENSYIKWEMVENILHPIKTDVLVIFDCCDAGYLKNLRSHGRAFEYLVACESARYTHGPGKKSFTAALIWALKELKTGPAFTTKYLREKITRYEHLPPDQRPLSFARLDLPETIWISPMESGLASEGRGISSSKPEPELRKPNCDSVDIRLYFNRRLIPKDAEHIAKMMKPLLQSREFVLNARHVSFIAKSSCKPLRTDPWRKAKTVVLMQKFKKRKQRHDEHDGSDAQHERRRRRIASVVDAARSRHDLDVVDADANRMTPMSDGHTSEGEMVFPQYVEPDLTRLPRTLVPVQAANGIYASDSWTDDSEAYEEE